MPCCGHVEIRGYVLGALACGVPACQLVKGRARASISVEVAKLHRGKPGAVTRAGACKHHQLRHDAAF